MPLPEEITDFSPILFERGIVAYPEKWQVPAKTEQAAYERIAAFKTCGSFIYIGFPWATLIDGLRNNMKGIEYLLYTLGQIKILCQHKNRVATTSQHILALDYISVFKTCNVTDLFWPHKSRTVSEISDIKIHPFPLYPAQIIDATVNNYPVDTDISSGRNRYLANFIGAFHPQINISNTRRLILDEADLHPDILIIERKNWHFRRKVYLEQMRDLEAKSEILAQEKKQKDEYLNAIRNSTFTLCPTGSGPNSIRIYESLALGSIPVILSKELHLPGDYSLWEAACLIEEDSEKGYRKSIATMRNMGTNEISQKRERIRKLYNEVSPHAYSDIICSNVN